MDNPMYGMTNAWMYQTNPPGTPVQPAGVVVAPVGQVGLDCYPLCQPYTIIGGVDKNRNNLYIKGLPEGLTEKRLSELFSRCGDITSVKVASGGVGFVRYAKSGDAEKAIAMFNGKQVEGYESEDAISVKFAHCDVGSKRKQRALAAALKYGHLIQATDNYQAYKTMANPFVRGLGDFEGRSQFELNLNNNNSNSSFYSHSLSYNYDSHSAGNDQDIPADFPYHTYEIGTIDLQHQLSHEQHHHRHEMNERSQQEEHDTEEEEEEECSTDDDGREVTDDAGAQCCVVRSPVTGSLCTVIKAGRKMILL